METKQIEKINSKITRCQLAETIKAAKKEIELRNEYHTKASVAALTDMINKAENSIKGAVCFSHKREFIKVEEDTYINFAYRRYTMAPTYLPDGYVFSEYGLEPALKWFIKEDMQFGGEEKLKERIDVLIHNAKEALLVCKVGCEIGCYGLYEKNDLVQSLKILETAENYESRVKSAVKCFDAYDGFRKSLVLRSDILPEDTLFFSQKEMKSLKSEVTLDPIKKEVYNKITQLAESHTLSEVEQKYSDYVGNTTYDTLNNRYTLWSTTGKTVNFFTPKETSYATISITLPSIENEENGLGHIWIDNINIFSADGDDIVIKNAGFEEGNVFPEYWRNISKNKGIVKTEKRPTYCKTGSQSLFMQNETIRDEAGLVYGEKIEIEAGKGFTLNFDAKQDGKLKKGLKINILYYDINDKVIGEFVYYFNKKSYLSPEEYPLTAQCDAICYALTEELKYAEKAKFQILMTLDDFCQGAEHWLIENSRPEQSDAYGAVQGGRILCSIASTYSLIKKAECFTKEEKKYFYDLVDYMLSYMLDLRNRTELTMEQAQKNCTNWQTDMCAGTTMIMLVLNDFPNRKTWIDNAVYILKAQLTYSINQDGSWPESIRYNYATLERFMLINKALKFNMGENWLKNTKLIELFHFIVQMQTPSYKYFQGHPATPPFGDHILGNGKEFAIFNLYIKDIEEINPILAKQMYTTWVKAGKPIKDFKTESVAIENLFCSENIKFSSIEELDLKSTNQFKDSGIYIFRHNVSTSMESYMAVMSSPEKIGHGHLDQGSFILFYKQIPLIMDSGIEGYFDTSTQWHISSYSHSCLQFQTKKRPVHSEVGQFINLNAGTYSQEKGWVDVSQRSKVLECKMGEDYESISIEIENPEGEGKHLRTICCDYEKNIYCIQDKTINFDGNILFNLPVVASTCILQNDNILFAEGYFDINLKVTFKSNIKKIWVDEGRTVPFFPSEKPVGMLKYIRAIADAKEGFCVTLEPR